MGRGINPSLRVSTSNVSSLSASAVNPIESPASYPKRFPFNFSSRIFLHRCGLYVDIMTVEIPYSYAILRLDIPHWFLQLD